ncbi:hypothetical protein CR513_09995, partial [Mucuna pruriens]
MYVKRENRDKEGRLFTKGDLVWVHLQKGRFPSLRNSKLLPRGATPFLVLKQINDNAYCLMDAHSLFGCTSCLWTLYLDKGLNATYEASLRFREAFG